MVMTIFLNTIITRIIYAYMSNLFMSKNISQITMQLYEHILKIGDFKTSLTVLPIQKELRTL